MSLGCCDCQTLAVAVPGISGPAGPPGPPGPAGGSTIQRVTATVLGGHRLVVPRDDGTVELASADDIDHMNRPIWLTTAAWAAGVLADLTATGFVTEGSWNWTPGAPIFLGLNGLPVQTIPAGALFARRVALVVQPTILDFDPEQPIALIP